MNVTKTSVFTGITRTRDLDVTQELLDLWKHGELIQNVFPNLSQDDREFLVTGATPEEWDTLMSDED